MSSSAQVPVESAANQVQIACKPLAGKYDGRGKYDRSHLKRTGIDRPGPKPLYLRHLCRSTSKRVLEEFERIAQLADIYRKAWELNDLRLCAELQRDVRDRYFGKAFVSVNPDEESKPAGILQDNRLQLAIQQLVVQPAAKPRRIKALPEPAAIEAAAKDGGLK